MEHFPAFRGLSASVCGELNVWKVVYDSDSPHTATFPAQYAQLSAFHRTLLVRCFRLDKVTTAVQNYVTSILGEKFIQPPPFNLKACYADSSPFTPLVFVLSAGSDPTAALQQFAADAGMEARLKNISLGDGQGPKAEKMIKEGAADGEWVVLFNCHLSPSWMPTLDKLVEQIQVRMLGC